MADFINRRTFLENSIVFSAAGALVTAGGSSKALFAKEDDTNSPWYKNAFRRAVVDMHISDWDEDFLTKFDPERYADTLLESRSQSIVCYCQSHVGLFNYPTKVGEQHKAFRGRNVFQEMIDACHKRNIAVQVYTSLIFDRWAGDQYPEWRIRTWDGKINGEGRRVATLCPNSPYREYVKNFVEEICTEFTFEGIRFDMTFWPAVCYCEHCKQRYDQEEGGDIPLVVDWLDKRWVAFQRSRERWLAEFASIATGVVRKLAPHASVEHQSSTYPKSWVLGVTSALAQQNDFLQGDFYGDQLQGSFVRKLLSRLSPNQPFGYETSSSVSLQDHTAIKSEELLEAKACAAIADSAAFIFIDAIDPSGTVNVRAHRRMGRVFDRLMPYYEHLGGKQIVDVGVYYSFESKFDMSSNGKHIGQFDDSDSHTQCSMQAASRLIANQLPLGVLTKDTLTDLKDMKLLVLANVNMMDAEECNIIRAWVRDGGKLLATGSTSLIGKDGTKHEDFLLSDVFGVSVISTDWTKRVHYIAPTEHGAMLFPDFDAEYPAYIDNFGLEVEADNDADVLAVRHLPWKRDDKSHFSSIHSDPPWEVTKIPEIVQHRFGSGQVIYCSSPIETQDTLADTYLRMIRLLEEEYRFEADAPSSVEVTMFHQPHRKRYIVNLVNFQPIMPNIPVHDIEVRLRVPGHVSAVEIIPSNSPVTFTSQGSQIVFQVPELQTFEMIAVKVS